MARHGHSGINRDNTLVNNQEQVVETFRRYSPPTFNGHEDFGYVEDWLRSLERTFKILGCTDAHRVICAEYQLVEDADHWWEGYWRTRLVTERDTLTWVKFKEILTNQYYPHFYRDQMEREFLDLTQGNMTVVEYERKLYQLGRFATHLINADSKKSKRFLDGLRSAIRHILTSHGELTYAETVKRAQGIAVSHDLELKNVELAGKRKWERSDQKSVGKQELNKLSKNDANAHPSSQNKKPFCKNCRKSHFGECFVGQGKCYKCRIYGHNVQECPLLNNGQYKGR